MASEQSPSHSLPHALLAPLQSEPSICQGCTDTMSEGQDCVIISDCSHAFHRHCIEEYLSTTSECPVRKRACQLSELRSLVILAKAVIKILSKANAKGNARGAMAKRYETRSTSRNSFQDHQFSSLSLNTNMSGMQTPSRNDVQNSARIIHGMLHSINFLPIFWIRTRSKSW